MTTVRSFLPSGGWGVTLSFLVLFFGPADARAQELDRFRAEMRMGTVPPIRELSEFLQTGPTLWVGGRYLLNRRFAVTVEGCRSYLPARDLDFGSPVSPSQRSETDARFQHVLVGAEVGIIPFGGDGVGAAVRLSTGRTSYDMSMPASYPRDSRCLPPPRAFFLEDAWTAGLGAHLSYELQPSVRLTADADVLSALQQRDDQMVGAAGFPCRRESRLDPLGPGTDVKKLVEGFDYPTTIPLTFGLSVSF